MIIVTGGAGFIGSALVHALNQRGEEDILVVDTLGEDSKWRNLSGLVFSDYMEREEFRETLWEPSLYSGKVKAILHLGACSSTTETDASYLADNNFRFTKELALFAKEVDARFVYASSAATYGNGDKGYDDKGDIRGLRPLNGYALSKQMFDLWALKHGMLDRIAGIKYFNVYGPNESHKAGMKSMVCRGFEQARDEGVIRLFKSDHPDYAHGEQKRDFLYIRDAVAMTLFLMDHPEVNGLFNAGSGRAETWNELAHAIFKALGLEPKIEYIDMPVHLKGKYQYYTCADISKLRESGYSPPITTLEDAVRDYVVNYLAPDKRLGERDA